MFRKTKRKVDLVRLAAFVDSGGSIIIEKSHPKDRVNPYYRLRLTISSSNRNLCAWCKEHFGGGISTHRSKSKNGQVIHVWQLSVGLVIPLLTKIQPYIVFKKEQLHCALRFYRNCMKDFADLSHSNPGICLPESILVCRERHYQEMKQLNKERWN